MRTPVVLGLDVGTTNVKVLALDQSGRSWGAAVAGYQLGHAGQSTMTQDPDSLLDATVRALGAAVDDVLRHDAAVAAISVSTAMHSLIALDATGRALSPFLTWADTRAAAQAERLSRQAGALALQRRTGVPLHPMSPLAKLVWFADCDPHTFEAARRWVGIKEVVLAHLTGEWVVDHSIASGTGLFDVARLNWDAEALSIAGIEADQLCEPVAPTTLLPGGLRAQIAKQIGLEPGTLVIVGAGDGPLANVGVGAVRPGVAAVSIGTSGAVRIVAARPATDERGGIFCYVLAKDLWVIGGAINNGGAVLDWACSSLAPDLGGAANEQLLAEAARAPAGSENLIALPYLLGERAPHWSSLPLGAYVGLTAAHRRPHLIRALLEGVCQQLALILAAIRGNGHEVREIRATGGFARSALWRQMLTDALGQPVAFAIRSGDSAAGAALLGMYALGLIGSIDQADEMFLPDETRVPDERDAATLAELRPVFADLYNALRPAFTRLHEIGSVAPHIESETRVKDIAARKP